MTISIVSHRQNALANSLLRDLTALRADGIALILTENVPDPTPLELADVRAPYEHILNRAPAGFGANHNAAFRRCRTEFFCVSNPDVRLRGDPFPMLMETAANLQVGAAGPLVLAPSGRLEDSARRFPTVSRLLAKTVRRPSGPDYPSNRGPITVDWIAGMFMLFRSDAFRAVGGFDEAYFLYYEDVDLCLRLRKRGLRSVYDPRAEVVHDARRASRRNPRLALHHVGSLLRFLTRRRHVQ